MLFKINLDILSIFKLTKKKVAEKNDDKNILANFGPSLLTDKHSLASP